MPTMRATFLGTPNSLNVMFQMLNNLWTLTEECLIFLTLNFPFLAMRSPLIRVTIFLTVVFFILLFRNISLAVPVLFGPIGTCKARPFITTRFYKPMKSKMAMLPGAKYPVNDAILRGLQLLEPFIISLRMEGS